MIKKQKYLYNNILNYINEDLLSDLEDDDEDDSEFVINSKLDDKTLLKMFNELYNAQFNIFKKYKISSGQIFDNVTNITKNGVTYRVIDSIQERHQKSGKSISSALPGYNMFYFISSQKLINFMEINHIIIGTCPTKFDEDFVSKTPNIIFDSVKIPEDFLEELCNIKFDNIIYNVNFYFNNCNISNECINKLLCIDTHYLYIQSITLNKCNDITLISAILKEKFALYIISCDNLKDIWLSYVIEDRSMSDCILSIKKLNNLTNLYVTEQSKFISLLKFNILDCPNINKGTLVLPNHNVKTYNMQIFNDKSNILKKICFRGDAISWFYHDTEKGKSYRYKYLNYDDPYQKIFPYWKKGEY